MGYGNYSDEAYAAIVRTRASTPRQEVFQQRACHPLMIPHGVKLRECRDSDAHPQSIGIVFALDVTGSMGEIPKMLARRELPQFMKVLGDCQVRDPQLLFCAVGDVTSDQAPLQVGQFESTAELMDQWLTWSYLEGGGGGTGEESYELAMYFLAVHTEMDCAVKRGKRGYLFMTGDEHPYPRLSRNTVESVVGDRLDDDLDRRGDRGRAAEDVLALLHHPGRGAGPALRAALARPPGRPRARHREAGRCLQRRGRRGVAVRARGAGPGRTGLGPARGRRRARRGLARGAGAAPAGRRRARARGRRHRAGHQAAVRQMSAGRLASLGRALRTAALAAAEIRSLALRGFLLALLLDAVVLTRWPSSTSASATAARA